MCNSKRLDYIDSVKGILIILVVLAHGLQMNTTRNSITLSVINSIHMPTFFILSGMLFNAEKWHQCGFKSFLQTRVKSLLKPWLAFESLALLVRFILEISEFDTITVSNAISTIASLLLNSIPIKLLTNCGANWFLIALFFAEILLFVITLLSVKNQIILATSLAVISTILDHYLLGVSGIKWIGRTIIAFIFVETGNLLKPFISSNKKYIYTLLCIVLLCSGINGINDLSVFKIKYITVYICGGIAGAVLLLTISRKIGTSFFSTIGQQSLIIMGTHQLVKYFITAKYPSMWEYSFPNLLLFLLSVALLECIAIPFFGKFLKK